MTQLNLYSKHLPNYFTAKCIVENILKGNVCCRGNDKRLIENVVEFCKDNGIKQPAFETITRIRRKFNEKGMYLPDNKTIEKRKEKRRFFENACKEGLL